MLTVPGRIEKKELFILAPEAVCISCRIKMNDVILRHEARKNRKKDLELISYSWQRVPPFSSSSPFIKFCPTSPPLFCCLVSLTESVIAPHLMRYFLLENIMNLSMSSLLAVIQQGPNGVLYATMSQFIEV